MHYALAKRAALDVAHLIGYLHREVSPAAADALEERLFKTFDKLAAGRAMGHRRNDVTSHTLLFYTLKPYVIVLRGTRQTLWIVRVVHGSRDFSRLF